MLDKMIIGSYQIKHQIKNVIGNF